MARWRLLEAHYLKSPDVFWEQEETDRETGRKKRRSYPVPLHLDPGNPADWNYKPGQAHYLTGGSGSEEGQIVVCWEGKGFPKDIVMLGDPTPGMKALDKEAEEITAKCSESKNWGYNPDAIFNWSEDTSYANKLINQAAEAFEKTQVAQTEMQQDMKNMMSAMTQVLQQNAQLLQALTAQPRRV